MSEQRYTPEYAVREIEQSTEPLPQLLRRLATESVRETGVRRGSPTSHLLRVIAARMEREQGGRR